MTHPNVPAAPDVADPVEAQVFVLLAWRALICARLSDGIVPNLPARDQPAAEALALRTRTEVVIAALDRRRYAARGDGDDGHAEVAAMETRPVRFAMIGR